MTTDRLGLLHDAAEAVQRALRGGGAGGFSGQREGQYRLDLRADAAVLEVLRRAGVGVLSEESGLERGTRDEIVIVDPVDGSTNADRGVPWYATSLCLVDGDGPAAALVVDLARDVRYWAERGDGAHCDGRRLQGSGCSSTDRAVIAVNGVPRASLGTWQTRMFGAAALDLCLVAAGALDGYVDCATEAHGVWDYAGAALVCSEAGVPLADLHGRPLIELDPSIRRTPVAAATGGLFEQLVAARLSFS